MFTRVLFHSTFIRNSSNILLRSDLNDFTRGLNSTKTILRECSYESLRRVVPRDSTRFNGLPKLLAIFSPHTHTPPTSSTHIVSSTRSSTTLLFTGGLVVTKSCCFQIKDEYNIQRKPSWSPRRSTIKMRFWV